jgi:hypothetical protein
MLNPSQIRSLRLGCRLDASNKTTISLAAAHRTAVIFLSTRPCLLASLLVCAALIGSFAQSLLLLLLLLLLPVILIAVNHAVPVRLYPRDHHWSLLCRLGHHGECQLLSGRLAQAHHRVGRLEALYEGETKCLEALGGSGSSQAKAGQVNVRAMVVKVAWFGIRVVAWLERQLVFVDFGAENYAAKDGRVV